jgi:hypothetical protein
MNHLKRRQLKFDMLSLHIHTDLTNPSKMIMRAIYLYIKNYRNYRVCVIFADMSLHFSQLKTMKGLLTIAKNGGRSRINPIKLLLFAFSVDSPFKFYTSNAP